MVAGGTSVVVVVVVAVAVAAAVAALSSSMPFPLSLTLTLTPQAAATGENLRRLLVGTVMVVLLLAEVAVEIAEVVLAKVPLWVVAHRGVVGMEGEPEELGGRLKPE